MTEALIIYQVWQEAQLLTDIKKISENIRPFPIIDIKDNKYITVCFGCGGAFGL